MRRPVIWVLMLVICEVLICESRYWHQESRKDVRHRHRHQHNSPSRWSYNQRKPVWQQHDYDEDTWRSINEDDSTEDEHDYYESYYHPKRKSTYNKSHRRSSLSHRRWYQRFAEEMPKRKHHLLRYHESKIRQNYPPVSRDRTHYYNNEQHQLDLDSLLIRRYYEDRDRLVGYANARNLMRKHRDREEQKLKTLFDYIAEHSQPRSHASNNKSTLPILRNKHRTSDYDDDYQYYDNLTDTSDKDNDNVLWKNDNEDEENDDDDDDDDDDEEEEESDDEDYEDENNDLEGKPPLKTFEDIIERLTGSADYTTTPKSAIKKDVDIGKYLKRDVYGNLQVDPSLNESTKYFVKSVVADGPVQGKVIIHRRKKNDSMLLQTKSVDPDYDEYTNDDKNDQDNTMQADILNEDYAEDNVEDNDEEDASLTTSTTAEPFTSSTKSLHYNHRDVKSYDSTTGPQYNGYHLKNEYPAMSAHSLHKWQTLGTRESVKETRGHVSQTAKSAEMHQALQHIMKVMKEGSCQWPRARVIPVQEIYPSLSTTYIPHCAILHRCSDDTGCCKSEALTCVAKHTQRVELYFYAMNMVQRTNIVEKLTFYNHTQCECREKRELNVPDDKSLDRRIFGPQSNTSNRRQAQKKPCRCPSEFTPRVTSNGECQCNCYENDDSCIRASRGKVYFSLTDRLCIQNETCAKPTCEFGAFNKQQGRCPRKRDRFDEIASHHLNQNHRFHKS